MSSILSSLSRLLDSKSGSKEADRLVSESALAQYLPSDAEKAQLEQLLHDSAQKGNCVECMDHPRELFCEQCQDDLCRVCFESLHRRGHRKDHVSTSVSNDAMSPDSADMDCSNNEEPNAKKASIQKCNVSVDEQQSLSPEEEERAGQGIVKSFAYEAQFRDGIGGMKSKNIDVDEQRKRGEWLVERCKYLPVRISLPDRKYMRLVENALDVSEYTDHVDIISWKSKNVRIHAQLKELCSILCGLVMACDYELGQELLAEKNFEDNAEFFQSIFEITRRHKIRNPEKLRNIYGKLVHILMDSQSPAIQEIMGFSLVRPLKTVHAFLKENDSLDILIEDYALIMDATCEVNPSGKKRSLLDKELKLRDQAMKQLIKKYRNRSPNFTEETLEMVFRSIGDNNNYLRHNRDPVDRMLHYLKKYFHSDRVDSRYRLDIRVGHEGARLSHTHDVQYHYVLQSMTLWREILNEMFQLWYLAELDLFDPTNPYSLRDTGQGLNRVQSCPRVSRAIRNVVHKVHQQVGSWVGSSVVHLGDRAVPNALMFVDKYNQVADILNPIDITVRRLDEIVAENPALKPWILDTFGSVEDARLSILCDFFRHGFDGSGADNFYDAGSCIDGRLTSAWNWCQNLSKKPFYPLFLLAGFSSFNGEW